MKPRTSTVFTLKTKEDNNTLFQSIWLRWQVLTQSERVVCLGIILIPLWWITGWSVMLLPWVAGVFTYEIWNYKQIRLSRPSIEVIAVILFSFYTAISYVRNSPDIAPRALIDPFLMWGCGGLLLWYIQSHNIRVRLAVVAWAFSIMVCIMFSWWLFLHFVLSEPYYTPPRTLFASILDKGTYDPSQAGSVGNFLVPYYFGERGFGGLYRHNFFFPHPTISSFAIGFAGLVVLDMKNRLWSLPIVTICGILILIGQARNAWIVLSVVLAIRWLLTTGRTKGFTFLLMLFAITSFITLSLPSVTDYITETYSNTVEATTKLRKDSTDDRAKIYLRTWESVLEDPLLGHGVNGPPVQPGYDFARIGTESFVLGTLLYKSGVLGTAVFITFFIPFLAWMYKTRRERPLCCFLMLLYFILTSLVTEFQIPEVFMVLLCAILYSPNEQQFIKKQRLKENYE